MPVTASSPPACTGLMAAVPLAEIFSEASVFTENVNEASPLERVVKFLIEKSMGSSRVWNLRSSRLSSKEIDAFPNSKSARSTVQGRAGGEIGALLILVDAAD